MGWYRTIRTMQEHRAVEVSPELVRPKRNRRNLPGSYDDRQQDVASHNSWKDHRKTQYRPVAA